LCVFPTHNIVNFFINFTFLAATYLSKAQYCLFVLKMLLNPSQSVYLVSGFSCMLAFIRCFCGCWLLGNDRFLDHHEPRPSVGPKHNQFLYVLVTPVVFARMWWAVFVQYVSLYCQPALACYLHVYVQSELSLKERLTPRTNLAPLLLRLEERPPEKLDYIGVSYGLTSDLLKWANIPKMTVATINRRWLSFSSRRLILRACGVIYCRTSCRRHHCLICMKRLKTRLFSCSFLKLPVEPIVQWLCHLRHHDHSCYWLTCWWSAAVKSSGCSTVTC